MSEFFKPEDYNVESERFGLCLTIDKANRLLRERGTVVYGSKNESLDESFQGNWFRSAFERATHTALLIAIEPIERDSESKIVEDLLKWQCESSMHELDQLIDRAKRLKGGV